MGLISSLRTMVAAGIMLGCVASCGSDSDALSPVAQCIERACSFKRGRSTLADVEAQMGMPIEQEQQTDGSVIDVLHYRCGQQAFSYTFRDDVLVGLNIMGWGADVVAACLGEGDAGW